MVEGGELSAILTTTCYSLLQARLHPAALEHPELDLGLGLGARSVRVEARVEVGMEVTMEDRLGVRGRVRPR